MVKDFEIRLFLLKILIMSRFKSFEIHDVKVEKLAAEGKALARVNGLVVFIRGAVPGDIVDLLVVRKKKNYLEAKVLNFKQLSPYRQTPKCQHFGVCGGCRWQNLQYEKQLEAKQNQVVEAFEHIAGVSPKLIRPILPSDDIYFYRNKLEFTFSAHRWLTEKSKTQERSLPALGFHVPLNFYKVVDIQKCWLQPEPSNHIRNFVRKLAFERGYEFYNIREHTGFLRNLIIRNNLSGQFMVILQVAQNRPDDIAFILESLRDNFPQILSLYYILNQKKNDSYADLSPVHFWGEKFLIEDLDGLKFRIHPKSFFQTNTRQALKLYRVAKEFAQLTGNEVVYDLYTGTGTIALFVARDVRKVIGIEYIAEAIEDARENARFNHIENAQFFVGDLKDVMNQQFIQQNGKPDVIILDPPRAGMHKSVVEAIKFAAPQRIVYVSCNPATQARDVKLLSDKYDLIVTQPVDMFPHTHHVENVALLEKKS